MSDEAPGAVINALTLYIAEGSIAAVLSIPLAIAMLANRNLRIRREFQVIIGICVVDAGFGIAFIMSAASRLHITKEYYNTAIPLIPRWKCSMTFYVQALTLAYQLQGVLAFTVAADRLLAIMIPIRYLKFDFMYSIIIGVGPYVFVAVCSIINAIITMHDDTPVSLFCLTVTAVSPGFYDYILLLRICCISISAIAYILIVARMNKHFARVAKLQVAYRESNQFRSARRSTITVGLSTANAVIFLLLPDVVKYIGVFDYSRSYVTILYSLSMTNVILNVFIFAYRHMEIFTSLKHFLYAILRLGSSKSNCTDVKLVCRIVPKSSNKAFTITHTD